MTFADKKNVITLQNNTEMPLMNGHANNIGSSVDELTKDNKV
jgi:hypothetical protein